MLLLKQIRPISLHFLAIAAIASFSFLRPRPAIAEEDFLKLTCHMGECVWYRVLNKIDIRPTETGRLVGATLQNCTTTTKADAEYPKTYQCKPTEISLQDYVANCSISAPSLAFKYSSNKWQRTKLSISEDAEFGYNRSSIDLYLRICHDFVRKLDSLDMLAAKFGYKSRANEIKEKEQDTVSSIEELVSERQPKNSHAISNNATSPSPPEGFRTPSNNIFCQVLRFDKPYVLRCDALNLVAGIPPKPRDCRDTDWGGAFEVSENGIAGHRICYTDTVYTEALEELPYGVMFRTKEFTCKSEMIGVTCANTSGHGFFISKRAQSVF